MSLLLIYLKDLLDLQIQRLVDALQVLGDILMYGTFTDSEMSRNGANGGSIFYQIGGKYHASVFPCQLIHITFHSVPLLFMVCSLPIYVTDELEYD